MSSRIGATPSSWTGLRPADPLLWSFLSSLWVLTAACCPLRGITLTGGSSVVALVAALLAAACVMRQRRHHDQRVAILLECVAALIGMSLVFGPLSYLAARSPQAPIDGQLRALDLALGLDAARWRHAVTTIPALLWFHRVAYNSFLPQVIAALLTLPLIKDGQRGFTLLRAASLALFCDCALSDLFPAAGALPRLEAWYPDWLLLHGSSAPFVARADHLDAIISFPSFHAVMAVLIAYSLRGLGAVSVAVAVLDGCMIVATPAGGQHYLADVAAGIALAIGCLVATRWLDRLMPAGERWFGVRELRPARS